jgi:hypothetical protein
MFAFHDEFSHVADVENAGIGANGLVFVVDAGSS